MDNTTNRTAQDAPAFTFLANPIALLAASLMAGCLLLTAPALAQDEESAEDTTDTRRAPSWRPQAPTRPDMPDMPPDMSRPDPTFEIARPEIDLPILDLGSEQLSAQVPSDDELGDDDLGDDELGDDELAEGDAEFDQELDPYLEQQSPEPETAIAATEDAPSDTTSVNDTAVEDAAELASSTPENEDLNADPANADSPAFSQQPGESVAESDIDTPINPPAMELSTAAVLPQEQAPAFPDLTTELQPVSSPPPAISNTATDAAPNTPVAENPASTASNSAAGGTLVATRWVRPTYPRSAYRKGTEGWVQLRVTVDPAGQVSDIELVDSKPRGVFVREAMRAANQWAFEALAAGQPQVNRSKVYQIDFTLSE